MDLGLRYVTLRYVTLRGAGCVMRGGFSVTQVDLGLRYVTLHRKMDLRRGADLRADKWNYDCGARRRAVGVGHHS